MTTRPGQLREYIQILNEASNAGDELPRYSSGDKFAADVHAEIVDVGGGEMFRGRQIEAEVDCVVTIRYRSGVQHNMQITTSASRTLNIRRIVDPDGRRRFLELHCSELRD